MPKANDFVCTLAPVKNFTASDTHNKFYNATSWLEKKASWFYPEPDENTLSHWLACQGQGSALSQQRGPWFLTVIWEVIFSKGAKVHTRTITKGLYWVCKALWKVFIHDRELEYLLYLRFCECSVGGCSGGAASWELTLYLVRWDKC